MIESLEQSAPEPEERPLLSVRHLRKSYGSRPDSYAVLDDVSFDVHAGETLGIVGESGCGKSTLARSIMRLGSVSAGSIELDGVDLVGLSPARLREHRRHFQMVFQDPFGSLDPRMTVRALVEQPLAVHGERDKAERRRRAETMLEQLGLPSHLLDRTPAALSGGQRQRVAIARALVVRPRLTVLDEPISALDVSVQAQVLNLLREEQLRLGLTYLFIVHDLAVAEYFCDRILVLYLGEIVESGTAEELFADPKHPYTVALLSAAPDPRREAEGKQRIVLHGDPQSRRPERGCPFAPRCPLGSGRAICHTTTPPVQRFGATHAAACHFAGELAHEAVPAVAG